MRLILLFAAVASSCWAQETSPDTIRSAIAKAIPLIEAGSRGSAGERTCFTCHSQGMPILALLEARKHGFEIDAENFDRQVEHTFAHLERGKPSYEKGVGQGGKADTAGMALWALDEAGREPDEVTDAVVGFLLGWNDDTPNWKPQSDRPPSEGSLETSTFLALRGLLAYGQDEHREQIDRRRSAALAWLESREPEETEDAIFRLRALKLLGVDANEATRQLLALQREDGGWAQQPELESEAYSTGSALAALELSADDEVYQRGIAYLLKTQLDDGSWHVVTRSRPIQKYYESGFPHGADQFLSSSATCWAVLALMNALPDRDK